MKIFILIIYLTLYAAFNYGQNPYFNNVLEESEVQTYGNLIVFNDTIYSMGRDVLPNTDYIPYFKKFDQNGTLISKNEYLGDSFPTKNWFGKLSRMENYIYMGSYERLGPFGSTTHGTFTKFNFNGDTLFRIVDTLTDCSYSRSVAEPQKGTITVAGEMTRNGYFDVYIVQYDTSGNRLWSTNFGNPNNHDQPFAIDTTGDGGYVVAGYQYNNPTTQAYRYVVKLDSLGNVIWEHKSGNGYSNCLVHTVSPEKYLITGMDDLNNNEDGYIGFIDSSGVILWDTTYKDFDWPSRPDDQLYRLRHVNDGYVIIGGLAFQQFDFFPSGLLLKVDLNGRYLWHRWYQPRETDAYFNDIAMLSDSSFVIAGYVFPENASQSQDAWLLRLNCLGYDTVPRASFNLPNLTGNSYPQSMSFFNNSAYAEEYVWDFGDSSTYSHYSNPRDTLSSEPVIQHTYKSPGVYQVELAAIACNDTSYYSKTIEIVPNNTDLSLVVYPNPSNDSFNLWAELSSQKTYQLVVFSADGRLIYNTNVDGSAFKDYTLPAQSWAQGPYILRLMENDSILKTVKLIKN